jgi:MSHA biogenesis protein MshK
VSLILEALKKVERERATPEQRGFLVLGPTAWAESRSHAWTIGGMVIAALLAGGTVYLLTRPAAATPTARVDAPVPQAAPPAAPVTAPPRRALVLNAISDQRGVPVAVINDRLVREGDAFDGVRVLRIHATEVDVDVDGARRTLRF